MKCFWCNKLIPHTENSEYKDEKAFCSVGCMISLPFWVTIAFILVASGIPLAILKDVR